MTEGLSAGVLEIQPHELVSRLLQATGQDGPGAVDPSALLDFLKLRFLSVEFATTLATAFPEAGTDVRALLSFPDRLVAVDTALGPKRIRFSVLHEIGHYVLPSHRHALYLCDAEGLGARARLSFEIEANRFAADLLFKGARFSLEANGEPVSARTVKALALRYDASFEATARRLVERHHRPVLLAVFRPEADRALIDDSGRQQWRVRHCATSPSFRVRWFATLSGVAPVAVTAELTAGTRDVGDGLVADLPLEGAPGERFRAEWFFNRHHVMALVTPGIG